MTGSTAARRFISRRAMAAITLIDVDAVGLDAGELL
jgi:hypothetical protein